MLDISANDRQNQSAKVWLSVPQSMCTDQAKPTAYLWWKIAAAISQVARWHQNQVLIAQHAATLILYSTLVCYGWQSGCMRPTTPSLLGLIGIDAQQLVAGYTNTWRKFPDFSIRAITDETYLGMWETKNIIIHRVVGGEDGAVVQPFTLFHTLTLFVRHRGLYEVCPEWLCVFWTHVWDSPVVVEQNQKLDCHAWQPYR